eukprot:252569_1
MADLPMELKKMKRFIREAKKTEKVSPIIAYYCRLYAIQQAMKLDESKKTATTKQWMGQQMSLLEENKVDCSREEAKIKITSMAHNVFKHADEIDRAGKANKTTAAAFNSAFVFYTILKQFGDRDEQIIEAAKYCMFKVTDILKALKEGRTPKPGPPGDDPNEELNQELNALNDNNNINNPSGNNDNFSSGMQASPQPTYQPMQPQSQQPSYQQPMQPQQPSYQQPMQPQQPSYQQTYSTIISTATTTNISTTTTTNIFATTKTTITTTTTNI